LELKPQGTSLTSLTGTCCTRCEQAVLLSELASVTKPHKTQKGTPHFSGKTGVGLSLYTLPSS
jgi:hypothetical protein